MEIPGGELKGTSKTDVFDVSFVFNMPYGLADFFFNL